MTDSETSELQPLVRAYLASALKEIEWQVSPDLGSEWLAGEIVDHRHWQHLVAVVRADERAKVTGDLSQRFLAERDRDPTAGRRRVNRDYNAGYRMAMEDAASMARGECTFDTPPVLPVPDKEQQQ